MRGEFYNLGVALTVGSGDKLAAADLDLKWLQVITGGASGGSVDLEGSMNGVDWVKIGASILVNTAALIAVAPTVKFLRLTTTVNIVGGTPTVILGASQGRSSY